MVDISPVRRIILVQVSVAVVIALMMLLIVGVTAAVSAFLGGAIGFLTSLIYAKKMLAPPGSEAKKIIRAHYSAEAYKLIFTILLFSLVFTQYKEVHALSLFATYAATLAVYWIALIFV
ncbi:MAG: ATP synthase subunit I [Gallionellaceae bacterium]|jgi:ATP synthase protein I